MNAIKPEIHVSLFGRKKKPALEATASTEEVLDKTVDALQGVATNTVAIAEEAIDRLAVKLFVGAVAGGAILLVINTAGKILTNALDNRNTN